MSINKFLMFGDSITEFAFSAIIPGRDDLPPQFTLGAALSSAYARRLQVLHRGYSGYTSRDALKIIGPILEADHDSQPDAAKIKLAYVFFGTNDARVQGSNPANHQHVELAQFVANVASIVKQLLKRDIKVVVITPGIHDQTAWNKSHPEDLETGDFRTNEINKKYADVLEQFCQNELHVPVVHAYNLFQEYLAAHRDKTPADLLADGIHYTGTSYSILYEALLFQITENWPELAPENIVQQFPQWREL